MARRDNSTSVRPAPKSTRRQGPLNRLYREDETAWLDKMTDLIRLGRLDELDRVNLAEFLESTSERSRREINSRIRVLVAHLLKWQYQPEKHSRSWKLTIINQRNELEGALTKTLRKHAQQSLGRVYQQAVKIAAYQTELPATTFPAECPYVLEQILTEEFF